MSLESKTATDSRIVLCPQISYFLVSQILNAGGLTEAARRCNIRVTKHMVAWKKALSGELPISLQLRNGEKPFCNGLHSM